jgi:hypothetical protein
MQFQWDPGKATTNFRKHRIRFENAVRVFVDPHRIEKLDTRRDYGEDRWETIGFVDPSVLVVIYTVRDEGGDIIRIISARKANIHEKAKYRELHP